MSKEEIDDIRNSIKKLEKDEEERIKRMRELISQFDIKNMELDSKVQTLLDSLKKSEKT